MKKNAFIFVSISFLCVTFFTLLPLLYSFGMTFFSGRGNELVFSGFDNYTRIRDVFLYLRSLSANEDIAEEIAQETFAKALKAIDSYDGQKDIRAWLFTIAKNTYFTACKHQNLFSGEEPSENIAAPQSVFVEQMMDEECAFQIHSFLHNMKEPYKEVFTLRVFGELPFDKISKLFGKSPSWARVVFYRAKTQIKEYMEEETMSKFSCDTVRDMLPLYVDHIVSDDTRAIVEEHLASCDACRKEYETMKNAVVLPADGDAKQLKRFKGAWKKKKRVVALTAVIATILVLCIGYGIFDHFAYREEIAVNGAVYARSRETVSEIPEASVELGYLRSILHRNIGSPSVDFSGTNLDEKYGGCGLYQDPENEMVIYLEDYGGFYIPFVLKEYIVQPETP